MSKLTLYDVSMSRDDILKIREGRFLNASPKEKLDQLLRLIRVSIKLNGGKPLKTPQGNGIVIRKKNT